MRQRTPNGIECAKSPSEMTQHHLKVAWRGVAIFAYRLEPGKQVVVTGNQYGGICAGHLSKFDKNNRASVLVQRGAEAVLKICDPRHMRHP